MRIIVIGLGTVGETILKNLSNEGHTITIIDENKDIIESLIEKYDVFGVVGNGACMDIQEEANVAGADLAIVLTNSDELNVFACLVAKKAGVKNTIARVRNPLYRKQILSMKEELGISMIVNPEQETANEIFNLPLQNGFYNRKVQMSRAVVIVHKNRRAMLCKKEREKKNVQNCKKIIQIQYIRLTVK